MATSNDHRLPRDVVPRHYAVTLEPDLGAASFTGSVDIELDVVESTSEIVFNAAELDITAFALVTAAGVAVEGDLALMPGQERAEVLLPEPVSPGAYRLHLEFSGALNDQLRGFYRSVYVDDSGTRHVLATTQFEATDARRAFPCWDEPDRKATFDVILVVPNEMTAISCSPIVDEQELGDGRRRVRFGTTMPLSTYLLAFVVGRLEATEPVDVDGVPLRVVHVPGNRDLASFALEFGAFALRWLVEYYGVPYPGEKVDLIAIPDFASGAMENLGAITFRESVLLVDPAAATQAELSRVAEVIAHELAHMWFGDLVTMKWWNGLWLKEAFATFMEVKCVDAFRPEWKSWLSFAAERASALETDALVTTRPIEFPVGSPEEADEMYDDITYGKGASVLRMLEQYLGPDTFRRGIAHYLASLAYGNADTPDLWAALEEVSGEPIGQIMGSWIFSPGFPEVEVTTEPEGRYRLRPTRFQLAGDEAGSWQVPLLLGGDDAGGKLLLSTDTVVAGGDAFLVNQGGQGFYRVAYDERALEQVAGRLATLDPHERFTVVSDAHAHLLAGSIGAGDYLRLVARLTAEPEAVVWDAMVAGIDELDRIASSDAHPDLHRFARDLTAPGLERMGWAPEPDESDLDRRLRGTLLRTRGVLGEDPDSIAEARRLFAEVAEAGARVDGEVAAAVVAIVAASGDHADYLRLVAAYQAASSPQDETRYLRAMAAVPEPSAAAETVAMLLGGEIRTQHAASTIARLIGNRHVGPAAWEVVKEHWDDLIALLPPFNARIALTFAHLRSEPEVAADIADWLAAHPLPAAAKYTAQQLERLAVRVALREREATMRVPRVGAGE